MVERIESSGLPVSLDLTATRKTRIHLCLAGVRDFPQGFEIIGWVRKKSLSYIYDEEDDPTIIGVNRDNLKGLAEAIENCVATFQVQMRKSHLVAELDQHLENGFYLEEFELPLQVSVYSADLKHLLLVSEFTKDPPKVKDILSVADICWLLRTVYELEI
jgi:hypothetical protein